MGVYLDEAALPMKVMGSVLRTIGIIHVGTFVYGVEGITDYYTPEASDPIENLTIPKSDDDEVLRNNKFYNYEGDLVGWRDVTTVEFPFVVSITHAKYLVHVCTGVLITIDAVLTFMRCVVRKKTVAGKVSQKLDELSSLMILAGMDNLTEGSNNVVVRDIVDMMTPHPHNFKGHFVFLMVRPIPYTFHHRPVKLYSTDAAEMGRKFEEEARRGFCEIITWKETIVCPDGTFIKPVNLQAYRVKIGRAELCISQTHRLGIRTIGEWTVSSRSLKRHCYVGMGGRLCGSTPGAPIICRGAIYGITSMGSSCGEFGDYGYFVPLNETDVRLLFNRAYPIERSLGHQNTAFITDIHAIPYCVMFVFTISL